MNNLDLDSLKSGIQLSSLFSSMTRVERHGRDVFALCPFHQERTPSCKVDDAKGFFYCFGCCSHGDAIDFIRRRYNCSFKEALEKLGLKDYKPSKAALAKRKQQQKAYRREQEAEQKKRWEDATETAERVWNDCISIEGRAHPYLEEKGVDACGLRGTVKDDKYGFLNVPARSLVIPLRAEEGKLRSLQFYFLKKKTGESKWPRFFLPGGRTEGCFHLLGDEAGRLLLSEGYVTGSSIHMATGEQVVVCFSSGNMPAVASVLRRQYPTKKMIICADADEAGLKAAKATGLKYMYPRFDDAGVERFRRLVGKPAGSPSDFNDYMNIYGLGELKQCLMKI